MRSDRRRGPGHRLLQHVRNILAIDAEARTAEVEPGMVLDHLNATLKPHGLWYPVDVSTSAQATLGGMADNNSCGSHSIAYGNMVHNVLGATAWLSSGSLLELGRYDAASGEARRLGDYVKAVSDQLRPELEAMWPKVLLRVAGYNLDIFNNQSEKPYTTDGSVNLSHLLVGSEETLALTKSLKLRLSELPRVKVLGVVNFPTFYKAMDSAQHIARLGDGTLTAVELVDRTMIELSLQNPAFAATVQTELIGEPEAILLVEFSGNSKAELTPKIRQLVELMGELVRRRRARVWRLSRIGIWQTHHRQTTPTISALLGEFAMGRDDCARVGLRSGSVCLNNFPRTISGSLTG